MKVLGLGQHLRFHSHTMCNRVCNNNVIGYVKWCEMLNHLTWTQFHSNFISLLMETYQSLWSGCWDFKHVFKMNTYFWQEFWILNALVTLLYLTCNYKHTWPCSENVNLSRFQERLHNWLSSRYVNQGSFCVVPFPVTWSSDTNEQNGSSNVRFVTWQFRKHKSHTKFPKLLTKTVKIIFRFF